MNNETALITLQQRPVIEFSKMEARGIEVAEKIKLMNLDTIEATEENRGTMKKMKAELNRELKVFEDQRKLIHGLITKPYTDFTKSYDENIKVLYKRAEEQLKEKISLVEEKMLSEKYSDIKSYFNNVNDFNFLTIDQVGLNVILSVTDKKLCNQVDEFLKIVTKDIDSIKKMDHQVRIMSLYEKTLDLSGSVSQVLSDIEIEKRLEAEKIEREKSEKEAEENQKKQAVINAEREAKERAERKKIEAEKAERDAIQAKKNAELSKTKEAAEAAKLAEKQRLDAIIQAEQAREEEEQLEKRKAARVAQAFEDARIYTMEFKVSGTKKQLKKIKEKLNQLGVTYE